uniref:Uncharacterized protein n=1 Tax=Sinocyclocheilus rhinocerous TaxID=307959 RepID=A0A673N6Q9_9TELE
IIYEAEAEQWASYLHFHLVGPIPEAGICCYDIALVTSRRDDFLRLGGYKCKLLILSRGMLEGLCQLRRFFLARVLRPETSVVILLCGVESLDPLLELVPLKGDQCLQISSEQEPQDYQLAVAEIVHKGKKVWEVLELEWQQKECRFDPQLMPCCVSSQNPMEIFILLQEAIASKDAEVEFSGNKQRVRVKPVNWNESTLKVTAPGKDVLNLFFPFPECHSEDIPTLLHFAAQHGLRDLASALLQCPGSRQALKIPNSHGHTPLDLAHVHGHNQLYILLQESLVSKTRRLTNGLASTLLRLGIPLLRLCLVPSSLRLCQAPSSFQFLLSPLSLRLHRGLLDLRLRVSRRCHLLRLGPPDPPRRPGSSALRLRLGSSANCSTAVGRPPGEHQNNEGENVYTPLGRDGEEYDTILTSSSSVVIVNRPPAPTPRPDSLPTPEDKTPFIAQGVGKFGPRKPQSSRPRDSISTTYDTFVPSQPPGLDELIKLQQEVKMGSLSIDDALDRFNDWQRLQKGMDSIQQVMDMFVYNNNILTNVISITYQTFYCVSVMELTMWFTKVCGSQFTCICII